jgi:hypothetical protein
MVRFQPPQFGRTRRTARMPLRPAPLAAVFCLLAAGCANEPVNVAYEGFECPEVPGLGDFLEAADADNDDRINSDEFNAAFEEAEDEVTPDGQLDREELASYVCRKKRAAAGQPQ